MEDQVVQPVPHVASAVPAASPTPAVVPAPAPVVHPVVPAVPKDTWLLGKTIVSVKTYAKGSLYVIDLLATDKNHYFIKTSHNQCEIGGSEVWGTGVLQTM
jgi:hypothetical protein